MMLSISNSLGFFNGLGLLGLITPQLWYAIPLVIAISLVWGATRHERLLEIVLHSIRSLMWVLTFMAIVFGAIFVSGYFTQ